MKLDVGPPCWLKTQRRGFVTTPTHRRYEFELPDLPCMRLEEMIAEKVARLSRTATARDASDLVWIATTPSRCRFTPELVRRVAMLKVWVDNHGLRPEWAPALNPKPFDPEAWLSSRDRWDDEQIGLLTAPPPSLQQLEAELHRFYAWLGHLSSEEGHWAKADANDRGEVIKTIRSLEGSALKEVPIW